MSHDPAWTGADDLVPPFPQEPAFGSPEAVKQAAETLRGRSAREELLERGGARMQQRLADLLAEAERLRYTLHDTEHSLRQEEYLHRETKQEVARLRAEIQTVKALHLQAEQEVAEYRDEAVDARVALREAAVQRDALADALLNQTGRVAGEAFCEICGVDTPQHAEDCPVPAALDALRKAGRLP